MKAVVLEIAKHKATVMTSDGDIINVRNKDYDIGQEIILNDAKKVKLFRYAPVWAAAAVIFISLSIGGYSYLSPFGTVSLDVNPSIEYSINRYDRVLNVTGVNDDGQDIVSSINLSGLINKNIETAIDETIDQIDKNGFFTNENDNYVVVTVSSKREEHASRLKERLDRNSEKYGNITTITEAVSEEAVSEAHKMGLSAGKKMMVDRLDSLSNDSIDRKYWNEKSIRDIVREYDRIQELHSSSDTDTDSDTDSDSNTDSNSNIDNDFNMDMNSNTDAKSGDNQDTDEEKNKDVTPAADESGKKPEDIENRTVNDVPDIEKNTNSEYRDSDSKAPEIEQPSKGDQDMTNDHTSPGDNKDPTPPDDASKPTQNPPDNDSPPEPMIP